MSDVNIYERFGLNAIDTNYRKSSLECRFKVQTILRELGRLRVLFGAGILLHCVRSKGSAVIVPNRNNCAFVQGRNCCHCVQMLGAKAANQPY